MKNAKIVLLFILLSISYAFTQALPDFTVSDSAMLGRYFCAITNLGESNATKVGDNYLFKSNYFTRIKDSLYTDSLYFGFNRISKIKIKKISFKRNDLEYLTIDSFQTSKANNWNLRTENIAPDSVLFCDSMLSVTIINEVDFYKSALLGLKLDKKVSLKDGDTLMILLDDIPLTTISHILPASHNTSIVPSQKSCSKTLYLSNTKEHFPENGVFNSKQFNLSGRMLGLNKKSTNIYIRKLK